MEILFGTIQSVNQQFFVCNVYLKRESIYIGYYIHGYF